MEILNKIKNRTKTTTKTTDKSSDQNPYLIPASIIIAGLFMSAGLYFSGGGPNAGTANVNTDPQPGSEPAQEVQGDVREVTEADHIRGDISAPVKIIEYVDLECPFCQRFHDTLSTVTEEYGDQVAWIYRHGSSVHQKTVAEGAATECAAELGGNDAFWAYVDRMFEISPVNDGFDLEELPDVAQYVGLNRSNFEACIESGKYEEYVRNDFLDQQAAGGRGTPHTVVVAPNGKMFPIQGAQPYNVVKQTIDLALEETE